MATLSYDLIVLGDDLAGLIAATLCASRGMRVLLAEPHKNLSTYRLGKETVPTTTQVLTGLQRPGAERVIAELNFDHLMRRRLQSRKQPFQILGHRLRLDVHPDRQRLTRALAREGGVTSDWLVDSETAQAALDGLLLEGVCMPGTGFWERREVSKRLPAAHQAAQAWSESEHSEAEEFLARACSLASGNLCEADALAASRSVANILQGVPVLTGEAQAWRTLFLDKLQSHSGEHRVLVPEQIESSWGKVTGLTTVDDEIRCDHLIAAMPVHELVPLLSPKAAKKLANIGPLPEVAAYRYTLNLIVHTSGLPEGLSDLAASMLDADESPLGGNFALLSTRPATSPGRAVLCIEGLAPAAADRSPELSGMRDALLEHAQARMPFLDEHTELVDSPNEAAKDGVKRELHEPIAPSPIWASPVDEHLGMEALTYASGLKQLWLASRQTLPALGLEGQFIAAFGAAKLVSAGSSKGKASSKTSVLSAPRT
tara:strand:+ start:7749 stop:9206 length:1458 start_codon:yes stop_codon:yes gene_type:complete